MNIVKKNKGITLVALVITIIVLIILASITLYTVLGENGLIAKTKEGAKDYKTAAANELEILSAAEQKISGITNTGANTSGSSSSKTTIYNAEEVGTREVNFATYNCNVSDFDLLIVYYQTANNIGTLVFDTEEDTSFRTTYTYGNTYVFGIVSLDKAQNKITMTVDGNYNDWSNESATFIKKVIGIKL